MRTTRGAYPVLYGPDEAFTIGVAKVVRPSPEDQVTLIGAGVTLHNCLAAADQLARDGIRARIVDLYSVKPIDTQTLLQAAAATGDRVVVAEDHYPAGGIGSAVLDAFNDAGHPVRLSHLAVRDLPGSGTPAELMATAGISADQIAQAARYLLSARRRRDARSRSTAFVARHAPMSVRSSRTLPTSAVRGVVGDGRRIVSPMPGRTALAIRAGTRMEQGSVRPSVWLAAAASPKILQSQVHRETRLEVAVDDLGAVETIRPAPEQGLQDQAAEGLGLACVTGLASDYGSHRTDTQSCPPSHQVPVEPTALGHT
jgi:hypothetical protein